MNLNQYMNEGISQLLKTVGRYHLNNPRGLAFLMKTVPEIKKSAKRRDSKEKEGLHVPPFLIASVTSQCNLHCAGCYSRASGACSDETRQTADMDGQAWRNIFAQASGLGVSFIILAGGEPLMRRDVILAATDFPNMVFPVFTNGTLIDEAYLALFERHRNLIPVFSIEGDEQATDIRRGQGAYRTVEDVMRHFEKKKMLFGTSVTVTKENMEEVTQDSFVEGLRNQGCGVLFYVEYVPMQQGTEHLMLNDRDVKKMQRITTNLRERFSDMIVVSFPGDEEETGGCLASGRGFFHISASGGAEPCPFAPYSQIDLKKDSLEDALRSGFFMELRKLAARAGHDGGCTLFAHKDEVVALCDKQQGVLCERDE
ncbi:MAG: radical SAM protein [Christensenella sp.]|uniref:radical SAM/SPASM domain-containing protein n=1 Tax=Christensenella sp. TaxID=1935934 RepID=UPI002B1F7B06|nr:radical SAM protein [Christensenella sp.]MEA5004279.1 radical SAM protein [Christensenella sp.]